MKFLLFIRINKVEKILLAFQTVYLLLNNNVFLINNSLDFSKLSHNLFINQKFYGKKKYD